RAPKHDILPRPFEIIVHDLEGTGPVVAEDRLRLDAHEVRLRNVGVDDRGARAVEQDGPLDVARGLAMHIAAVDDEMMRDLGRGGLTATQRHDVVTRGHAWSDCELDTDKPEVVGSIRGSNCGSPVWAHDFGQEARVGGSDPSAGDWQV